MSCGAIFVLSGCGGVLVNEAGSGTLNVSPNPVSFGAVSIGQTANTSVSLVNGGSAPVEITQLNLTGQPFSVVASSDLPVTISAGGTYRLNVQFNPAVAGPATGQLTVASDASADGTAVIALAGIGMAVPPVLSALSCSSGAMTGSGTDACIVTLSTAAPSGGLIVNLSSSSSAVAVPSSVTVAAGANSAEFTATVASVATAQAVTMTASASGMFTSFTLQLNAAILALSINATTVAFGDVVVNTPATQAVTLTSAGTVPVTVDEATLSGAGFSESGVDFPATLSPGQTATLNIEFDPTTVGAARGQLNIASNSSTNGSAEIGLTGTGTAAPVVAVAVTPATASVTTSATQQFAASVTGTSNTAVNWTVSGAGCSGTTCGTISSAGLYTAPAAVPSSATVTIMATSVSDSTKSASVAVSIVPPQAAGYSLMWEDTFSALSLCTTNAPGCNWYNPGLWWQSAAGTITDPSGTYVDLNWTSGQSGNSSATTISTIAPDGLYYHAWGYGYFEASLKFDPAAGSSPTIYMVPVGEVLSPNTATDNQYWGEIDVLEYQSNNPTTFLGTVHVWHNQVDVQNNNSSDSWPYPSGTDLSGYNTYGLLWTPTSISWYVNNILMETLNTTSSPYSIAFGGAESYFIILGQQAGCNWTYPCTPTQTSSLDLQVQWVHVYTPPN